MDDNKPTDQQPSTEVKLDQKALDEAAAALVKPSDVVKPEDKKVEEHPISEADAKKFAGQGDFALPVSPLDDLIGLSKPGDKTETKEPAKEAVKPEETKKAEDLTATQVKTEAKPEVKPDVTPQPVPEKVSAKDLEKKAKEMLSNLDSKDTKETKDDKNNKKETVTTGGGVKKKRKSGAATKMALAAVVVVMMGVGGIAGMNLLKMNQSAETRSQASSCDGLSQDACMRTDCVWVSKPVTNNCTINTCNFSGCSCQTVPAFCQPNSSDTADCVLYVRDQTLCKQNGCTWVPESIRVSGTYTLDEGYCDDKASAPTVIPTSSPTSSPTQCSIKSMLNKIYPFWPEHGVKVNKAGDCNNDDDPAYGCNHTKPMAHFVCDGIVSSGQGCGYDNGTKVWEGTGSRSLLGRGCGMEQIDTDCGYVSVTYKEPCTTTPTTTPTSAPEPMMCTDLTASATRDIGETVTLTCSHSGAGFDHSEYQYKIDGGAWVSLGRTNTFEIAQSGTYTAQCRVCKADGTCTTWGAAN